MSILGTYMQKEKQVNQIIEKLDRLKNENRLKAELTFKEKLEDLMCDFDKSFTDFVYLLNPQPTTAATVSTTSTGRAKRKLKAYKNPNTEEVVETRGGNQKTLRVWKKIWCRECC